MQYYLEYLDYLNDLDVLYDLDYLPDACAFFSVASSTYAQDHSTTEQHLLFELKTNNRGQLFLAIVQIYIYIYPGI